jgi:hypothetical protein
MRNFSPLYDRSGSDAVIRRWPRNVRFAPEAVVERTSMDGRFVPLADIATMQQQIYLNTSTVANGSADHGRKRFNVNFVFCPGWTSTRR